MGNRNRVMPFKVLTESVKYQEISLLGMRKTHRRVAVKSGCSPPVRLSGLGIIPRSERPPVPFLGRAHVGAAGLVPAGARVRGN